MCASHSSGLEGLGFRGLGFRVIGMHLKSIGEPSWGKFELTVHNLSGFECSGLSSILSTESRVISAASLHKPKLKGEEARIAFTSNFTIGNWF